MDIGDIIRLLFFAFIFLSFFGGLFGRKSGEKEQQPQQRRPRPTDIFEGGGEPPGPRPVEANRPSQPTQQHEWGGGVFPFPEQYSGEVPQRSDRPTSRPHDNVQTDRAAGLEARHEEARQRYGTHSDRGKITAGEQKLLEQDVTMDTDPESRPRRRRRQQVARGRTRTGGDVLHRSLTNPETLERAFIVKEVLDKPLGMR